MKFTVLQSNFSKALNQVSRVVSTRTTLPVLSNILITAEKGKILLSATDLEVAITAQTTGKIDEEGSLTVPARLLADFIVNNTDESVEFLTDKTMLKLSSAKFKAEINGISAEEFPTVPSMPKDSFCELEKEDFLSSAKKVLIAHANDETRIVLSGVFFNFSGNTLIMAATDSYRLAEKKITLAAAVEEKKFIVPARAMSEAVRILGSIDVKNVAIFPTENQVTFKFGETQLVSRLIEGAFPNYTQIIPTDSKIKISVSDSDLASAIKMAAIFAKESANNIKITAGKDELIITTAGTQTGSSSSSLPAKVNGGEISISFNVRYIADVLGVLSSPKIMINLNDDSSSALISGDKDADFIYIVMPLKMDK